jgi:hypothetical protein
LAAEEEAGVSFKIPKYGRERRWNLLFDRVGGEPGTRRAGVGGELHLRGAMFILAAIVSWISRRYQSLEENGEIVACSEKLLVQVEAKDGTICGLIYTQA